MYGKTRICKYLEADWKDKALSDAEKTIQDSCKNKEHGKSEFIQAFKDAYMKTTS